MNQEQAIDLARDALFLLISTSAPIMVIALAVGLFISLFQALTQIQEMTLSFVPKMVAVFFSMVLILPYIGQELGTFFQRLSQLMVGG